MGEQLLPSSTRPLHLQIHGVYDDDVEHQPPALPAPSWPPCGQQEENQDNGVDEQRRGVPVVQDDASVVQTTLLEVVQTSQVGVGQVGHRSKRKRAAAGEKCDHPIDSNTSVGGAHPAYYTLRATVLRKSVLHLRARAD